MEIFMSWIEIGEKLTKFLHYLTGWIVHPDRGGCCYKTDTSKGYFSETDKK